MAQDPRIALANKATAERAEKQRLADIERRISVLERQNTIVQLVSGTPPVASREGTLAVDSTPRLWARVGGGWHFVGLT